MSMDDGWAIAGAAAARADDERLKASVAEGRYEKAMQRVYALEAHILELSDYASRLENAVRSRGKLIEAFEELVMGALWLGPVEAAQYPQRERDCDGYYEEANQGYWGC